MTLHDWWLLKTNANRLAVGGLATRERQGIRVFSSGAIAKRHDATTLETADGITITIVGFLNKSRTHQNGFPSEVCKHFLFGFPYHWEEYAVQCFVGESTKSGVSKKPSGCEEFNLPSTSSENNLLPASLDELPVTRVRDLLMSTLGDSKTLTNSIFSDIVGRVSNLSNMKGNSPTTVDTELDRTPRNDKKAEVEKFEDDNSILDVSDMRTEECKKNICQSSGVMNDSTPSRRVSTRTMTRLKNLKSQLEWNLSSSTSKKQKTRENSEKRLLTNSSNDVLRRSSGNDFKHARKDMKTNGPIKTMDSDLDKFIKHKMAKVEQKRTDNYQSMDTMDIRKEECQKYFCQSEVGMHALSPDRGVATRSMARLKNAKNNP